MKSAKQVVGYLRVSTDEQAERGVSLGAQEAAIRAYCDMRGLELAELVVDAAVSAGKPLAARAGGRRVLEMAKAGEVGGVVAYKLDRLFRDCADCLGVVRSWDDSAVALHLIDLGGQTIDTSTAMGRFFLTVMAGAAELERNLIGERTKAALGHIRSQGAQLGGEALGWRRTDEEDEHGRQVIADVETENETAGRIVELRSQGLTLQAIADQLTAEGRQTKRGGKWHACTVRNVLRRAKAAS